MIAVDYGTRRTGFAVADPLRIVVQPLDVCTAPGDGEELLAHVAGLLRERDVATVLVGLPLQMDGREGDRAADVRRFVARLRECFPTLEVLTWDERLSTKEAEDRLREAGLHGAERRARTDSWSARVVLEDWIRAGEPRPGARDDA